MTYEYEDNDEEVNPETYLLHWHLHIDTTSSDFGFLQSPDTRNAVAAIVRFNEGYLDVTEV